jgi:hypothetical protein
VPHEFFGSAMDGRTMINGHDPALNRIAERYEWLRKAGDLRLGPEERQSGGESLWVSPYAPGVNYMARFPTAQRDDAAPTFYAVASISDFDVLIMLVFIGSDQQVYWSKRLYG